MQYVYYYYNIAANEDYIPISTNLTFEPFQTVVSTSFTLINDQFPEGLEEFSIRIISYEEEISIHGDLLVKVTDARGKTST